ncbi:collagen-like protein [Candidatus Saccharibacteria bacterium]|nr:collagen-like protein [Candidatus Saccharibacteria bacterium]
MKESTDKGFSDSGKNRRRLMLITRTLAALGGGFVIIFGLLYLFHSKDTTLTMPASLLDRQTLDVKLNVYSADGATDLLYSQDLTASVVNDGSQIKVNWRIPAEYTKRDTHVEVVSRELLAKEESYDSSCAYFVPTRSSGFISDLAGWNSLDENQRIGCLAPNDQYTSFLQAYNDISKTLYSGLYFDGGQVINAPNTSGDINLTDINNLINQAINEKALVFAGPQGSPGLRGSQGTPGSQGEKGEKGSPGDTTVVIDPGLVGEKGAKGDTGTKGDKGDKGDPGSDGVMGVTGGGLILYNHILSLKSCLDGEVLKYQDGVWDCAPDMVGTSGISLTCTEGDILKSVGGVWSCAAEGTGTSTDTTYLAGNGLILDSDTNTFSINALACQTDEYLTWNGTQFSCEADDDTNIDTDTTYGAKQYGGLVLDSNNDFALMLCSDAQVLKYSSAAYSGQGGWICAEDADTTYDLSGYLQIANLQDAIDALTPGYYNKDQIDSMFDDFTSTLPLSGLKVPQVVALESELSDASCTEAGDYWFVQDMDVTKPDHTGRAWCYEDGGGTLHLYKVYDDYSHPDNVSILFNSDGQLTVSESWLDSYLSSKDYATEDYVDNAIAGLDFTPYVTWTDVPQCSAGSFLTSTASGVLSCAAASTTDTTYTAGEGITIDPTRGNAISINAPTCTVGQYLTWNGASFLCQDDADTVFSLPDGTDDGDILIWDTATNSWVIGQQTGSGIDTTYAAKAGGGLKLEGSASPYEFSLIDCSAGQLLKFVYNPSTLENEWQCAVDLQGADQDPYLAGTGIVIDSSNFIGIDATECQTGEFLTWTASGFACLDASSSFTDNDEQVLTFDNTNCKLSISNGNTIYLNCGTESCPPVGALRINTNFFDPIVTDVSGAVWYRMDGQTISPSDQATYAAGFAGIINPDGTLPVQQNSDSLYFYLKVFGNCAPMVNTDTVYEEGKGISFTDLDGNGIPEINLLYISDNGDFIFQKGMQNGSETESLSAFEVRDMTANSIFRVDTLNGQVQMKAIEDAYGSTGAYGQTLQIDVYGNLKWDSNICRDDINAPFTNIPSQAVAILSTNDRFLFTVATTASGDVSTPDNVTTYLAGQTIPANTEVVVLTDNTEVYLTGDIVTDGSWISQVKFCGDPNTKELPVGTHARQALTWDGSEWVAGEYITVNGQDAEAFKVSADMNDADKTVFNVDSVNGVVTVGTAANPADLIVNGDTILNGDTYFNAPLHLDADALVYDYTGSSGDAGDYLRIDENGRPVWQPIHGDFGDIGDYHADTDGIAHGQVMVFDAIEDKFVPMYLGINPDPDDVCNTQQNFSIADPGTTVDILVNRNTIQNRPSVEILKKVDSTTTSTKVRQFNTANITNFTNSDSNKYLDWNASRVQPQTTYNYTPADLNKVISTTSIGDIKLYETTIDTDLKTFEQLTTGYDTSNANVDQSGSLLGQIKSQFAGISSGAGGGYNVVTQNNTSLPIEILHFYGNYTYSTTGQALVAGDNGFVETSATDGAMLVLWFHNNLTVNSGATLTPKVRRKGMTIIVDGKLTNNGTISMTARGASATGQDVQLFKNSDSTFELVPAVGATGGATAYTGCRGWARGNNGSSIVINARGTGGGGGGAIGPWDTCGSSSGGAGGAGTSYSGGAGGGTTITDRINLAGGVGSSTGGAGGASVAGRGNASSGTKLVGGGAGNPAGANAAQGAAASGWIAGDGTGGLLNVYTEQLVNTGSIVSGGVIGTRPIGSASEVGVGGSSGGGSVNIFAASSTNGVINAGGGITAGFNSGMGGGDGGAGNATITPTAVTYYLFTINGATYYYNAGMGFVPFPGNPSKNSLTLSDFLTYGDISEDINYIAPNDLANLLQNGTILTATNAGAQDFTVRGAPQPQLIVDRAPVNLGMIDTLISTTLGGIISGNGVATVVVSANNGMTWYTTHDLGATWVQVSPLDVTTVLNEGIPKDEFDQLAQTLLSVPGFEDTDRLRFAYVLDMQTISDSAQIQYLELNYQSWFSWIKSENDIDNDMNGDYTYTYTSPTTLRVTFHKTGDFKVNVIGELCNPLTLAQIPEGEKTGQTIMWDNDTQSWVLGVGSIANYDAGKGIAIDSNGNINLLYIDDNGNFVFKNLGGDTANVFQVINAANAPLFTVDAVTGNVIVGSGDTSDSTAVALVLDSSTVAPSNPKNGMLYYDTTLNKFRCYENGAWVDCIQEAPFSTRYNNWIAGMEYDFGDGLYGQRLTGNITATSGLLSDITLGISNVASIVDYGGSIGLGTGSTKRGIIPFGTSDGNVSLEFDSSDKSIHLLTMVNNARDGTTNSDYNIWLKYTKTP